MASFLKFAATAGLLIASAGAVPVKQARASPVLKRSSSGKAGAAYNEASLVSALTSDASVISWAYNWGSSSDGDLPSGMDYVPMLWGTSSTYVDSWTSSIETAISNGCSYIMGFNEPDQASQANLTPAEAATYYKEYITPYASDAKLVSPAVTSSSSSGEGLSWFETFISECSDCSISVLAVHWYGTTVSELQSFITEAISTASTYGISEVWLTEFALSSDEGGISDLSAAATFVEEAGAWLNEQSALTRYSYFYVANGYLLTNGAANSVGEAYSSAASASSSSSSSSSTVSSSSPTTTSTSTSTLAPTSTYVAPTTTAVATTSTSSTEVYNVPMASTTSMAAPTTSTTSVEAVTTVTIKSTVTVSCVPTPPPCEVSSVSTPSWSASGFATQTSVASAAATTA